MVKLLANISGSLFFILGAVGKWGGLLMDALGFQEVWETTFHPIIRDLGLNNAAGMFLFVGLFLLLLSVVYSVYKKRYSVTKPVPSIEPKSTPSQNPGYITMPQAARMITDELRARGKNTLIQFSESCSSNNDGLNEIALAIALDSHARVFGIPAMGSRHVEIPKQELHKFIDSGSKILIYNGIGSKDQKVIYTDCRVLNSDIPRIIEELAKVD